MEALKKSEEWLNDRRRGIGGSDAKKIMEGDWHALWMEKTGRSEPEDLSNVLQVQLGTWTEPFNLHWFSRQTGKDVSTGMAAVVHSEHAFMRCNLDGWCEADEAVVEAKHVSAFDKPDAVVSRYYPQLQHMMEVTGADVAFLTVIYGNNKHEWYQVERDANYLADLIERERAFWWHVSEDVEPENPDSVQVSISLDDMREFDLDALDDAGEVWPNWAYAMQPELGSWRETIDAARNNKRATDAIKKLLPEDVKLVKHNGVKVARSRNGAVSVKEAS